MSLVLWAHKEEFRGVGPLALPCAEGISLHLDLLFYFDYRQLKNGLSAVKGKKSY